MLLGNINKLAGSDAPTLSIATVYRALKKLTDEGSICPIARKGSQTACGKPGKPG